MPSKLRIPAYRLHKPSGRAIVTIRGLDHYLGEYNSDASAAAYDNLIGKWLANGQRLPKDGDSTAPLQSQLDPGAVTVLEIANA